MEPENKKSDAEEILSEFQKTHGTEPVEEPVSYTHLTLPTILLV